MDDAQERRIERALRDTERALVARGYSARQAQAAVKTARKWAWGIAQKLEPQIRDQGFENLLLSRLGTADVWIERTREGQSRAR